MDQSMKSIILIGNSTFTFTEDGNETGCQEVRENVEKPSYTPFKTITITSNENNSDQNISPCLFDNSYGRFGYFTQDYSNLTLYLNDNALLSNNAPHEQAQWNNGFENMEIENYPFFSNENPVDFSFIGGDKAKSYLNNKVENDAPDYIDLKALSIPNEIKDCFPDDEKSKEAVPPFLKRNRKPKKVSEDDDVIFVKAYKNDPSEIDTTKAATEPRRNPKRQVQLQKVPYELVENMAMEDYFDDSDDLTRPSKTGAVFSPPIPLTENDFKEWPAEGMHEKPSFNPVTKKLEKLPSLPKKAKITRKKTIVKRKLTKAEEQAENKEFATMTHNTLHHVLSYIEQVKEYYKKLTSAEPEMVANSMSATEDLLLDSCILYCFANDVSDASLSAYFNTLSEKKDRIQFLKGIIDECEESGKENK